MFDLQDKSNPLISTIGVTIELLLSLTLGVMLKTHFLMEPIYLTKTITYFVIFSASIIYILYLTVKNLTDVKQKYVEGLVVGSGGAMAILLYVPVVLFTPLAEQLAITTTQAGGATKLVFGMQFFFIFYIIGIVLVVLLTMLIVKGSELYAKEPQEKVENDGEDNSVEEESEDSENDDTEDDKKSDLDSSIEDENDVNEKPEK